MTREPSLAPSRPNQLREPPSHLPSILTNRSQYEPPRAETPRVATSPSRVPRVAPSTPPETSTVDTSPRLITSRRDTQTTSDNTLAAGTAPAIEVQASGEKAIVLNKETECEVLVRNAGSVVADDVEVLVIVPKHIDVVDAAVKLGTTRYEPNAGDSGQVVWRINQLPARATERMKVTLIPRASRAFDLGLTWRHTPAEARATIDVLEPQLQLKISGPREVMYGDTKFYTILINNPGTGDAENVTIELLPVNPGGEGGASTKIDTLLAGERKELEIELTARQAGQLAIRAQATADGGLKADALQNVHVRRADLQLEVGGPEIKYAGSIGAYTVRVMNGGDANAEEVYAEAVLPDGAEFVADGSTADYDKTSRRVRWNVGGMRPGDTRVFELKCLLSTAGQNRVDVVARGAGELSTSKDMVTTVESIADLKLFVNDPKGPLPVGEEVKYEMRVSNRGTKSAEDLKIVVFFSDGIEPLGVQGATGRVDVGQVVLQPIRRVSPGDEIVFTITARANRAGNHVCRTELVCEQPDTRLANEEATRFYGTTASKPKPLEARRLTPAPIVPYRPELKR
jgi:uncharacterized repeat protein (TIGR01451 family)